LPILSARMVEIPRYPVKTADIAMLSSKKLRTGFRVYQKQLTDFSERQVLLRGQFKSSLGVQTIYLGISTESVITRRQIIGSKR